MIVKRKKYHSITNVERVAVEFRKVLQRWFASKGKPVDILNANDHFDANMAMDEALKKCGIPPFNRQGEMTQDVCDLWNAAWNRAAVLNGEKP